MSDDELEDLHCCDVSGDPCWNLDSERTKHVISVHDRVNREVHPCNPSVESKIRFE